MIRKTHGILVACLVALLWSAVPACAHKASIFAFVQGELFVAEGYFGGKTKAIDCVVEVFDQAGNKLKEGKTDANGTFSFPIKDLGPISGDVRFLLTAGSGHKADYLVSASELPGATGRSKTPAVDAAGESGASGSQVQQADPDLIKKIVEDSLQQQLAPVMAMLGSQQKLLLEQKDRSPSLTDIIGGIGWIFGILGIAGYFAGRKHMAQK